MQTHLPNASDDIDPSPPFVLEIRQEEVKANGDFVPAAAVLVTESLRQSGLLAQLSSDDFQTLLLVLSCITANGYFVSTPELLAPIAGNTVFRMRGRLRRLSQVLWREQPLVTIQQAGDGQQFFFPSPHLLATRHSAILPATKWKRGQSVDSEMITGETSPAIPASSREAVIAYSRANYGRPRAEVEAQIERFLRGEPEPSTPEEAARLLLRRRLLDKGLTQEQADRLLASYPPESLERQLVWLPYRYARNPAGLLMAAIEGDYDAPMAWRRTLKPVAPVTDENSGQGRDVAASSQE